MTGPTRILVVCLVLSAAGLALVAVGGLLKGNAISLALDATGTVIVVVCGATLAIIAIVSRTGWRGCIRVPLAMVGLLLGFGVLFKTANLLAFPLLWVSEVVGCAAGRPGIPTWLLFSASVAAVGAFAIGISWMIHSVHGALTKRK